MSFSPASSGRFAHQCTSFYKPPISSHNSSVQYLISQLNSEVIWEEEHPLKVWHGETNYSTYVSMVHRGRHIVRLYLRCAVRSMALKAKILNAMHNGRDPSVNLGARILGCLAGQYDDPF